MTKPASIRAEIHAIVTAAKNAGKPITAQIIWGLLSRDVAEETLGALLSKMKRARQLQSAPGPREMSRGGQPPALYEPGPTPYVQERDAREMLGGLMGNREHARLQSARKAARSWAKQGGAR